MVVKIKHGQVAQSVECLCIFWYLKVTGSIPGLASILLILILVPNVGKIIVC